MTDTPDRLYELLPVVYRQRDVAQGRPLQALLRVIAEQVDIVEADIGQLYRNWFIETAEDWVVPYIGDLIGYRPVHEAGEPDDVTSARARQRQKILIPRREVANTIPYRRRKGTLAVLELLAQDVARWPARAVEFYKLLAWSQAVNHLRLDRGRTVDVRQGDALDRLEGPFDQVAHTAEVRRINSRHTKGRYNIPSVALFVWRLRAYPVTGTPAYCTENIGPHCYTFSVLGNDTPLYTRPEPEAEPTHIAGELNLPVPIRRRAFKERMADYYGVDKSLYIWEGVPPAKPVELNRIVAADLSDWHYRPQRGEIAVDPVLGRITFPPGHLPKEGVWVSYRYGFSADIGGGEYQRPLSQPPEHVLYRVGRREKFDRINEALAQWQQDRDRPENEGGAAWQHAVIEITDSGVYVEQLNIELTANQSLQLRAANRTRPIIRLLDWQTGKPDSLTVTMEPDGRFILDGLLITGRGVRVRGQPADANEAEATDTHQQESHPKNGDETPPAENRPAGVHLRHATLVPGWSIGPDCEPGRPNEPGLEIVNLPVCVTIEHSIVGTIQVQQDEVGTEPVEIRISDSVLDATSPQREALGAPGWSLAHAVLTIERSTVFGRVLTHAIELAENSIFSGEVRVARRQRGCVRFCYVTPGSRTPRRYHCQPDQVEKPIKAQFERGEISAGQRDGALEREQLRVKPRFNSVRYGTPTYGQLAHATAAEIRRGADDRSELGVFHDLYQPQRAANLRTRLEEFTPAGTDAGVIYAS